ncbi:MAG: UDP-N-acetylmuramoyl-tripeptide--D-alanyl-D-alanine ligase [Marinilabiliales bacterium]|nr:UDP-N-acetylmuramoyl-tripeptide--D-alanyl-D-alanine ligase [Marinilabiliales bacterium]
MQTEDLYKLFIDHPVVTTDSRKIEPGSLFFALKGENFNGNTFAETALEKGAAYAIIDEQPERQNDRLILVEDVLQTLQQLATLHRKRMAIPILAITGTNGKTTTKELVSAILSKKFKLIHTQGNLNNHIGVPLTLLSINPLTEMAVVEMGANHPGEIDFLCRIALPDFGLITNVGRAHLEGFGSFEGVIRTKTELYRYLGEKEGTIFINKANPYLSDQTGTTRTVNYSTLPCTDCLEGEVMQADPYLICKVLFPKGWLYIKTQLVGRYNLENVLAAAAIGLHFGVDPLQIVSAIEAYAPDNNRSQLVETGKNRLLLDAYNANPTSTMAALENFRHMEGARKGIILGDMLELGPAASEEHQKVVDYLVSHATDKVFLVGPHYSGCHSIEDFHCFRSTADLSNHLSHEPLEGYLLLIKGSRGMKLEQIVQQLA